MKTSMAAQTGVTTFRATNHQQCLKNARDAGGPPLDPDLANAIKQLTVASGDANVFRDIFAEYTAVSRALGTPGCLFSVSPVRSCAP